MMMKKAISLSLALLFTAALFAQNDWAIVPGRITTPWAEKVSPANPLPEYPRPQMIRDAWTNLNGLWQYAIAPVSRKEDFPAVYDGKILVPFAVESALSGVGRTVGKDSVLWYKRTFSPGSFKDKRILLHFGAVDWSCDLFINGKPAGTHKGGYDPFTFDITPHLTKAKDQEILLRVWDPSDEGPQPRGKQVKKPEGIWYTPVTGIWQTVWTEAVPATHIVSFTQTPDIDHRSLTVNLVSANLQTGDEIKVTVLDGGQQVTGEVAGQDGVATLTIPSPKLWSPSNPFLYDLTLLISRKGKTVDVVKGYFAMRKISVAPDKNGIQRMLLNNGFLFEYGPLDQGWWPDGLYTAPTDEALKSDIMQTKQMGFNMIRKHVKVEPARWYAYCDHLGMLVWQDMPSGDLGNDWGSQPGIYGDATDKDRTPESESIYRTEWNAIVQALCNFPSIIVWTPFNEAWGQFKTREIVEWTMKKDPSRLVNTASGGNFVNVGPMIDLHHYTDPAMPDPALFGASRAMVLGEFGGLGLPIEGHTWQEKNNWGYSNFKNGEELFSKYSQLVDRFPDLIIKGLSAAVYTQTTDVEVEINGLMTYDRRVIKMPVEKLREIHQKLYMPLAP